MLSIAAGSLVVMLAATAGAADRLRQEFGGLAARRLVVERQIFDDGQQAGPTVSWAGVSLADLSMLKDRLPGLMSIAGRADAEAIAASERERLSAMVVGTQPGFAAICGLQVATGRFLSQSEEDALLRVAVVGSRLAGRLYASQSPVGQLLRLNGVRFSVIGVLSDSSGSPGCDDLGDAAIIPLRTALVRVLGDDHASSVYLLAVDSTNAQRWPAMLDDFILARQPSSARSRRSFVIRSSGTTPDTQARLVRTVEKLCRGIAASGLVVGALGVFVVMFLSVRDRAGEIGLRRAVGASSGAIRNQLLLEAGMLAAVGATSGVAIGAGGAFVLARLAPWQFYVPMDVCGVSILVLRVTGAACGLIPALKAARLDPAEALRAS